METLNDQEIAERNEISEIPVHIAYDIIYAMERAIDMVDRAVSKKRSGEDKKNEIYNPKT